MADRIDITLVANAGVLVRYNEVGLLVDGVHHEDGHRFDKVAESDLERMRRGAEPFERLDYLLFTHEHPDHCTPGRVWELLRHRPVKEVFLPDAEHGSINLGLLLNNARKQGISCRTLGLAPGASRRFALADGLAVTAIGARHMGPQFQNIRNDCFLLSLGDRNLLFTGDADHVAAYYENALQGVALDAVFVNPIFYHNPHGQAIINEIFRPRRVVIYHLPPAQNDAMRLSFAVRRAIQKYERPDVRVHVLNDDTPQILLEAS